MLPNIQLHMVELAYGDRPFEVTNKDLYPLDVQIRTPHRLSMGGAELFHKENLSNIGVASFPPGWKYGGVCDADFHFSRHDLGLETIHQLQHYDWVQMFSGYTNVSGETEPGYGHRQIGHMSNGFAYGYVRNGCTLPAGYNGGWSEPPNSGVQSGVSMKWIGSPGGAWAFRRESFDAVGGMLDRCILGTADWYMAFGLAGHVLDAEVEKRLGKKVTKYTPAYLAYIRAWQKQAAIAIKGNIGYVDCYAIHHFHGPIKKRGYSTRDDVLINNEYSPITDVSYDWQRLLQLTTEKPRLRDAIRAYFLSRSEDMPHIRPDAD